MEVILGQNFVMITYFQHTKNQLKKYCHDVFSDENKTKMLYAVMFVSN